MLLHQDCQQVDAMATSISSSSEDDHCDYYKVQNVSGMVANSIIATIKENSQTLQSPSSQLAKFSLNSSSDCSSPDPTFSPTMVTSFKTCAKRTLVQRRLFVGNAGLVDSHSEDPFGSFLFFNQDNSNKDSQQTPLRSALKDISNITLSSPNTPILMKKAPFPLHPSQQQQQKQRHHHWSRMPEDLAIQKYSLKEQWQNSLDQGMGREISQGMCQRMDNSLIEQDINGDMAKTTTHHDIYYDIGHNICNDVCHDVSPNISLDTFQHASQHPCQNKCGHGCLHRSTNPLQSSIHQIIPLAKVRRTMSAYTKVDEFVSGPFGNGHEYEKSHDNHPFKTESLIPDHPDASQFITSNLGEVCRLPCYPSPKDAIKRIDPATVVDIIDRKFVELYDQVIIVDCRYPYEYAGGHIPTAVNVNTLDAAERLFFTNPPSPNAHIILIFHCEFSSERAPRMALHVRNMDRMLNGANYPALYYPEIYILEGGYKHYFEQFRERCDPCGQYMPMRNPLYKEELKFHQRMKHSNLAGQKHRSKLRTVSLSSLRVRKANTIGDCTRESMQNMQIKMERRDVVQMALSFDGPLHAIPSSDGPEIEPDHGYFSRIEAEL